MHGKTSYEKHNEAGLYAPSHFYSDSSTPDSAKCLWCHEQVGGNVVD